LIISLYFVLDGRRLYAWMLAYVPRQHREKMARTVPEVTEVVFGYVRGQLLTSALFAVFCAVVLTCFGVPAALPLALLAGICDIIPVVGIVIATAPALLLSLTVSPTTAFAVTALYVGYHLLEAYVIVPRVYGKSLRLSTLSVLLALIVGGSLQGIIGAVIVLPLVAAYPIIERIWLKGYLAPEVIQDHSALARAAESGRDTAIDAVLNGEEHPISRRM
jgi:predicted PurR-regulated permease PerM